MKISITIDCPDPDQLAEFWVQFLGYVPRPDDGDGTYVTIDRPDGVDGPPTLTFQRVCEPKITKVRMHLDVYVEHAAPIVTAMIAAGATSLTTKEAGQWTTRVLQDPAGNEFCVIGPD
ncbi:MAG: VOC family protein [Actinomycetota bacterium]|nr:VOC family protein [Actinomycetota bacterium]